MEAVYKTGGASRKTAAETSLVPGRPSIVSLKVAMESVFKFERRGDDPVLVLRGCGAAGLRGCGAAGQRGSGAAGQRGSGSAKRR